MTSVPATGAQKSLRVAKQLNQSQRPEIAIPATRNAPSSSVCCSVTKPNASQRNRFMRHTQKAAKPSDVHHKTSAYKEAVWLGARGGTTFTPPRTATAKTAG